MSIILSAHAIIYTKQMVNHRFKFKVRKYFYIITFDNNGDYILKGFI